MIKSLKFASQFLLENLLVLTGLVLIIFVGCLVTGVPAGATNLFATYYTLFPLMYPMIVFITSFAWCTNNLNLALSYGCRRRDFFHATQLLILTYILFGWLLNRLLCSITILGSWNNPKLSVLFLLDVPFPLYALFTAALVLVGCALGPLYLRSRLIGSLIMMLIVLIGIGSTTGLLLLADHSNKNWGDLPLLLTVGLAFVCAGSEWYLHRIIHKATVR
mgnify:CR=1 FL=1